MGMNGTDILLLVNTGTPTVPVYEAIGSQRGVTFTENTAEIDVSSKDSRAKRVIPGRYSAKVSMEALYVPEDAGYQALKAAMLDGTPILVARSIEGVTTEIATAIVTDLSPEGPDQEAATVSVELSIDNFWQEVGS